MKTNDISKLKGIYNFDAEIDFEDKTITLGDICTSGATYEFTNIDDLMKSIKFYIENYIIENALEYET